MGTGKDFAFCVGRYRWGDKNVPAKVSLLLYALGAHGALCKQSAVFHQR